MSARAAARSICNHENIFQSGQAYARASCCLGALISQNIRPCDFSEMYVLVNRDKNVRGGAQIEIPGRTRQAKAARHATTCCICCLSFLCCCAVRYMLNLAGSLEFGGLCFCFLGMKPPTLETGDRRSSRDGDEAFASGESINMLSALHLKLLFLAGSLKGTGTGKSGARC